MGKTTIKKVIEPKTTLLTSENEVAKLVKIVVAVIILFALFYIITVFVTKKKEEDKTPTPVTIQYEEIVVGMLLSQSDNEYYVMAYRKDDKYLGVYAQYLEIYGAKEDAAAYYTINMDEGFNAGYIGEEENLKVTNINDLKVNTSTLFRIKKGKIVEAYSNRDKIIEYLAGISKSEDSK